MTRPSLWPVATICPSASIAPAVRVEEASDPGRDTGQAVHALIRRAALGEEVTADMVRAESERCGVDPLAVADLFERGAEALASLAPYLPSPLAEVRLEDVNGTADLLQLDLDDHIAVVVVDWKMREYLDPVPQLRRYAWGGVRKLERDGGEVRGRRVIGAAVWLATGQAEIFDFTPEDFEEMHAEERRLAERAGKDYKTGTHCIYCPRKHECPAVAAQAGQALALIRDGSTVDIPLTREAIAEAYVHLPLIERAVEWLKEKAKLEAADEPIPLPNGKNLSVDRFRTTVVVDPSAAFPVLQEHGLTHDDLTRTVNVILGRVKTIVRSRVPRGQKKDAEAALVASLRQAGAIEEGWSEPRLIQRKPYQEDTDG